MRGSKHDGCQEYKWDGGNVTVIECVCSDKLCNKDEPNIPSTTPGMFFKIHWTSFYGKLTDFIEILIFLIRYITLISLQEVDCSVILVDILMKIAQ